MQNQAADGSGELPEAGFLDDLEPEAADEDAYQEPELESEPEPEEEDSERPGLGFAAAAAGIVAGVLASGDDEDAEATVDSDIELAPESEAGVAAAAGIAAGTLASGGDEDIEATADSEGETAPSGEAAAGMFDQVEKSDASDGDPGFADETIGGTEVERSGEEKDFDTDGSEPEGLSEGDIPDWMQEAGWGESSGEFKDAPVSFSDHELKSLDAGEIPIESPVDDEVKLTPAELPDWIHDIAPEEVEEESDGVGIESLPGWIGAEAPSEDEPINDATPPTAETELTGQDAETEASFPAAKSDTSELPTWIASEPPGATETIVTWLEDRGPDSLEDDAVTSEDLPDWMRDTGPLEDSADSGLVDVPDEIGPPAELPLEEAAEPDQEAASAELAMEEAVEAERDVTPSTELPIEEPIGELPGDQASDTPSSESWLSAVAAVAAEEDSSPSSPEEKAGQTPEWLSDEMETPEDSESDGAEHVLGLAAAAAAGMIAGKDKDEAEASDKQDVQSFAEEIETADAELDGESAASDQEIEEIAPSLGDQPEPSATSPAPVWLEEIGTLPDQPMQTDSADWLEGLEIDGEDDTPAEPAPETPDWLKGLAEEGADTGESGAAPAADWLREIGDPGSVSEEEAVEEAEVSTQDEYAEQPEEKTAGGAPDWLQATRSDEDEEATPEADLVSEAVEFEPDTPAVPAEEDDEVMDWLQDLAAKQAEAPDEDELESAAQVEPTAPVLEDRDIPDEPEEGLEWLEQLADQRGLDVDVSVPGQAAPASGAAEPEPESDDTAPGWLGRMATQPIPKVDKEALEAAARSEGIDPQAETINAQAADIQAQLDEVAGKRDTEEAGSERSMEVAPDDITIESSASDLQAEIEREQEFVEPTDALTEPAQDLVEPTAAPTEVEPEDEIPDWLIAAAEQAEPPSDAPSGLPAEFVEDVQEPEPEAEPAPTDRQEYPTESAEPSEPKTEAVAEEEAADEIQSAETMDEEVEVELLEPEEPAQLDVADEVETPEVAELADKASVEEAELSDVAEPAESTGTEIDEPADIDTGAAELTEPTSEEPPSPEVQKKEDLLERSRHALASGDTQSATELYGDLVKRKVSLKQVIEDLRIAVDRTPDNADLWQLLGDAYMRDDQTDEAIDAYRKGMEAA
jgi:tetratricopeptide (TPR) repeat protein